MGITSLRTNETGTKLIYSTSAFKLYLYDLVENFNFEKVGKVYYTINFLFFDKTDSIIFTCG